MSLSITVELGYELEVRAKTKDVFALLANVPESASYYPQVQEVSEIGKNTYLWEMEKIGLGGLQFQTVYAAKYTSNKTKGTIVWTPVQGQGNALVGGSWTLTDNKKSTHLVLQVQAELALPAPELMRRVITPLVEAEFEHLTEKYIDNLIEVFGGEVDA